MKALERSGTLSLGNASIIRGSLAQVNGCFNCNRVSRAWNCLRLAHGWPESCKRLSRALALALLAFAPLSIVAGATPEWAVAIFPSGAEFALEIAADPVSQQRGYMFREHVGAREGMLFIYEETARPGIWMKNCKVSLDIIWLDKDLRVVDLAPGAVPCPEEGACPAMLPARPARYVLEVAGGTAAREGLQLQDRLVILSKPPLP